MYKTLEFDDVVIIVDDGKMKIKKVDSCFIYDCPNGMAVMKSLCDVLINVITRMDFAKKLKEKDLICKKIKLNDEWCVGLYFLGGDFTDDKKWGITFEFEGQIYARFSPSTRYVTDVSSSDSLSELMKMFY